MRLYPRKDGNGRIGVYNATIGAAEARRAGFINEDSTSKEISKVVDEEKGTITLFVQPQASKDEQPQR